MKFLKVLKFFLAAFLVASVFFLIMALELGRLFGVEYTLNADGESYTLSECGVLNPQKTFEIPSTYQGKPVTKIGEDAFRGCCLLKSVTIPDSVETIGDGAFSYCDSLVSVTIPDSVTTIGGNAFSPCLSLESVTIPDSVTTIGDEAFFNCDSLVSVTIGGSVTTIGDEAFSGCGSLVSVYYKGDAAAWNAIDIYDIYIDNAELESATIYYYSETAPTESGNYWHYGANGKIEVWP